MVLIMADISAIGPKELIRIFARAASPPMQVPTNQLYFVSDSTRLKTINIY